MDRIKTIKIHKRRWRLLAAFRDAPEGFEFDGASVPRVFWAFLDPASEGFEAACLHDWRLSRGVPWDVAAWLFRADLIYYGVPRWRAQIAYLAIRFWGLIRWVKHRITSI